MGAWDLVAVCEGSLASDMGSAACVATNPVLVHAFYLSRSPVIFFHSTHIVSTLHLFLSLPHVVFGTSAPVTSGHLTLRTVGCGPRRSPKERSYRVSIGFRV